METIAAVGAAGGARRLVTKAELARITGRSAGRISQWIKAGRLHGAALEITPEGEKVNLAVALAQLGASLDMAQQLGQAKPLLAGLDAGLDLGGDDESAGPARALPPAAGDQQRLLKAKADEAEHRAHRSRIDLLAQNGAWARIGEIEPAWRRNLGDLLGRIEAALPELAEQLAGEPDPKAAIIATRQWWRALRAKLAGEAKEAAASMPTTSPAEELADAAA